MPVHIYAFMKVHMRVYNKWLYTPDMFLAPFIYIIYSHIITCTIQEMSKVKKACRIDYASTLQIETANWHQVDRSTSFTQLQHI